MLYSFADPAYVSRVNQLASEVFLLKGCTADFRSVVQAQGVTHIYIKEGAGSLKAEQMDSCPGVEEIFHIGKVSIYRVIALP
jgi:hypothetical protein